MRVTMTFDLPEDQADYDAARLGRTAIAALWEIDQRCRALLKHGEPTPGEEALAEEIRAMIPGECLEV